MISDNFIVGSRAASFKRPLLSVDVSVCVCVCVTVYVCLSVSNYNAKYLGN